MLSSRATRFTVSARRVGTARIAAPRRSPLRRNYADNASSNSSSSSNGGTGQAITGGLVGAGAVLGIGYIYYRTSGLATVADKSRDTQKYLQQAKDSLKEKTPEPNEALQWLRDTALSYAALIPGGKRYVNTAFDDLDAINEKHGNKVSKIASEAYTEIRDATQNKDVSLETAQDVWSILQKHLGKIAELAGDSAEEIMNRHPEIKDKVGGSFDELKKMGDKYGPEAKKEVDETWEQVRSVASKGFSPSMVSEVKQIVDDKVKKLKEMRDGLFDKGVQEAKPYLDKSPKAKELIENNMETLKEGDLQTLWEKVKDASNKGDAGALEQFVKQNAEKVSSGAGNLQGGLDQILKKVPGGENISSNISRLVEAGQKHGDEAQNLLNSAVKEIGDVLKKKVNEADKLKEKAKRDT